MNLQEVLAFARDYLLRLGPNQQACPASEFRLHGQLQYRLCGAIDRLQKEFKEVTRKDVALLCEAWVMAQAPVRPNKALLHDTEWDDGTSRQSITELNDHKAT